MEFLGGFEFGAFLSDDADKLVGGFLPVSKQLGGLHAASFLRMKLDERPDFGDLLSTLDRHGDEHHGVDAGEKFPVRIHEVKRREP